MKVAIPLDSHSEVSAHFGRSPAFLIFTLEDGRIEQREIRANDQVSAGDTHAQVKGHSHAHSHDHNRFVRLLGDCQAVIGLGMGAGARVALEAAGINVRILADSCSPEEAAISYAAGHLEANPGLSCGCHGHSRHIEP